MFRAGLSAYQAFDYQEAYSRLHHAVHLDLQNRQAKELLAITSLVQGCGPPMPACALPFVREPNPWEGLGEDLKAHIDASRLEARRLEPEGPLGEADNFTSCASSLAEIRGEP